MMERIRNSWLDCIAGLLILRMILGHYVSYVGLKDSLLFHSLDTLFFYMPWFFFKSGMFYRGFKGWEHWRTIFCKNLKALMLPYFVFSVLGILVGIIYYQVTKDGVLQPNFSSIVSNFVGMGCYYWSSHLWFLLTLFVVKIITPPSF